MTDTVNISTEDWQNIVILGFLVLLTMIVGGIVGSDTFKGKV